MPTSTRKEVPTMDESREPRERGKRYEEMVEHAPYFREAIFRTVFSEPEQLLELFQSLSPEHAQNLKAEDIQKLNITSVPSWCYDCIAFLAGDHIVIVQDAGSDLNDVRLSNGAYYIASAITTYADAKDIDLYANERVHIPEPECYVLYASEEGDPVEDGKHMPASLGALSYDPVIRTRGSQPGDILDQYIVAGVICDEEGDSHDTPEESAKAIARECLERGLLPTYFVRDADAKLADADEK